MKLKKVAFWLSDSSFSRNSRLWEIANLMNSYGYREWDKERSDIRIRIYVDHGLISFVGHNGLFIISESENVDNEPEDSMEKVVSFETHFWVVQVKFLIEKEYRIEICEKIKLFGQDEFSFLRCQQMNITVL